MMEPMDIVLSTNFFPAIRALGSLFCFQAVFHRVKLSCLAFLCPYLHKTPLYFTVLYWSRKKKKQKNNKQKQNKTKIGMGIKQHLVCEAAISDKMLEHASPDMATLPLPPCNVESHVDCVYQHCKGKGAGRVGGVSQRLLSMTVV